MPPKSNYKKVSKHVSVATVPSATQIRRQQVDNNGKPINRYSLITIGATDKFGNDKYNSVGLRFNNFYERLRADGTSIEDSKRLARILTQQSIAESGYITKGGNFTGMNGGKGNSVISYSDPWQAHINNLDEKFGINNYFGNWRKSENINDFINHINAGDKYKTEREWLNYKNKVRKTNKDANMFLYNPRWENEKPYKTLLYDVNTPVNGYIDLLLRNNKYTNSDRYSLEDIG